MSNVAFAFQYSVKDKIKLYKIKIKHFKYIILNC